MIKWTAVLTIVWMIVLMIILTIASIVTLMFAMNIALMIVGIILFPKQNNCGCCDGAATLLHETLGNPATIDS